MELGVTGYHNIYNALACFAACRLCELDEESIARGLKNFHGAKRRMEWRGKLNGADVYDDYGHHPTEINATLSGAKGLVGDGGRLFCVYQPHTYSRTYALFDDFISALSLADRVITVDIYAARETDTLGVSSALLAERIGESAVCAGSFLRAADILKEEVCRDDTVIIMGAGDVYHVFDCLGDDLKK